MGHYGGRCRPFRSQHVDRQCRVVVSVFLLGRLASRHPTLTMAASFQAFVTAPSTPNRSLLRVRRFGTSWQHYASWQCRHRRQNRSRRRGFLLNAISCINRSSRPQSSHDRHEAPLPVMKHTTISQHAPMSSTTTTATGWYR